MSSNDSCIVYSVRGCLARNGELKRLLHQLVDRLTADHCRAETSPRQIVFDGLCEKLIGRLENLELIHVGFPVAAHHELRLNLPSDAGALQNRWILRLGAILDHLCGLLDLKLEIGLVGDRSGSSHDTTAR